MASTKLTLDEKMLVWHLYQAAIAGRDIYYDQRYRHNLAMRDISRRDPHACRRASPKPTLAELTRYTKLFWINTGPYNNLTARKFVLNLDRKRRRSQAAEIARPKRRAICSSSPARRSRSASSGSRRCSSIPTSIRW